jgi:hypothetical protein
MIHDFILGVYLIEIDDVSVMAFESGNSVVVVSRGKQRAECHLLLAMPPSARAFLAFIHSIAIAVADTTFEALRDFCVVRFDDPFLAIRFIENIK